jgi:pimeloyl-ACP methyl ester carboxylesterase
MKKILTAFLCIYILTSNHIIAQTFANQQLAGSWLGRINSGAISLRIIFNLSIAGKDSLTATLDSPDQGAKNLKIGPVTVSGENIKIMAPLLLGEYNGTIRNDSTIEGQWKQAGQVTDLELKKLKKPFVILRPQEPKPPFPYIQEEVTFHNDKFNIDLAGTLTLPQGKGPFPAAILITGSGAQNRNEELMGHKPFMVIADWLTRNGIAVLRYDDRGIGKSRGVYITSTSADFSTDAEAAFDFLRKDPRINPEKTGFIGHSEGGLIAPMVASRNPDVSFIISLAGPGYPGSDIISRQMADLNRAAGMSEENIIIAVQQNESILDILKKEPDNKIASEKMTARMREMLASQNLTSEQINQVIMKSQGSLNPAVLTWMRYFITTDPVEYWKNVKCPVLALNGDKDLQVSAGQNLPAIEAALKSGGNKKVTVVKLTGLNHLFQHAKTGTPSEYSSIEETFSPEALKLMTDWILKVK